MLREMRVILIQTFVKVFTRHEIIHRIPMCTYNENCGFMRKCLRKYISCCIGSKEKVFLTRKKIKGTLTFSRCSSSFCLSLILHYSTSGVALHKKEVDISKELYSRQLIYGWRSNPELTEKLRLISFYLSNFSRPLPITTERNNLKVRDYFSLQMF